MRLSTFILENMDLILKEWECFAITLFPTNQKTTMKERCNHAKQMLTLIAADLMHPQSKLEQAKKSKGLMLGKANIHTPADIHGSVRMDQGFNICELISEFRALRASVIKFFANEDRKILLSDPQDLVRFNEAIDQSLAEAVSAYSLAKEKQTRLFDAMLSFIPDLSYTLDLEGNFLYMNSAMSNLYQKPSYELLGKAIYNYQMPTAAEMREYIQYIIDKGKSCHGVVTFKDESGDEYFFQYVYEPVFDTTGKIEAIAGVSRDITEYTVAGKEVWRNANYDLLTGLANRRMFLNELNQALKCSKRSGHPLALLFIDLDHFKQVNDKLGHEAGDILLKQAADRIKACIRESDIVARIGGDEITVILENINNSAQVKIVAEKLLLELSRSFRIKQKFIQISASIGITISPQDGLKPSTLLRNADHAMYVAKKLGGNQSGFYSNVSKV
jgi:diguanylate cyclase (GGDEF)-like protein/PAS domain S-box-containing protein